jgi:hypothetical protein
VVFKNPSDKLMVLNPLEHHQGCRVKNGTEEVQRQMQPMIDRRGLLYELYAEVSATRLSDTDRLALILSF